MATFPNAILVDRIAMVRQAPALVHLWHRLYQDTKTLPDDHKKAIAGQVRAFAKVEGVGGFLAHTFLFGLTGEMVHMATAGRILRTGVLPVDASQAWLNSAFAAVLRSGLTGAPFIDELLAVEFADVVAHAGRVALAGMPAPDAVARLQPGTLRRVAVVVPNLSNALHAPTDMALKHCAALGGRGLQVSMFSTQEFRMSDMPMWLGMPRAMRLGPVPANGWQGQKVKMTVVVANENLSMLSRWRSLMIQIRKFKPDAVLYLGSFSPLMAVLHRDFPLAALGTNTIAPVGPMDVWLAPRSGLASPWSATFGSVQVREHSKRFSLDLAAQPLPRAQLGVPDDAVVWVTSGTRLVAEVGGAWLAAMLRVLEQQPHCHWLIVGDGHDKIEGLPVGHPRIHTRKFESQLSALVKACDIYLNPPRMGSGYTVADAMAQGLAVLTLPGGDGADKAGPWTQPDLDHYLRTLGQLCTDPQQRADMGRELKQRYAQAFDLNAGAPALVDALREAATLAAARPA